MCITLPFPLFCSVCYICCSADSRCPCPDHCCGSKERSDKYTDLRFNLLSHRCLLRLICEGSGHCHQADAAEEASLSPSPGLHSAGHLGALSQHSDQLPQQSPGRVQHIPCDTHLLRVLHHHSDDVLHHLVQGVEQYGTGWYHWNPEWILQHHHWHFPTACFQKH